MNKVLIKEKKDFKSIEDLDTALLYMKKIAINHKKIEHEVFTDSNFKKIEGKLNEESIVKTIDLFKLENNYLLAIYEYDSLKIKSLSIGLFDYEVKWASAYDMMFPLTNMLLKRALYKKQWEKEKVM